MNSRQLLARRTPIGKVRIDVVAKSPWLVVPRFAPKYTAEETDATAAVRAICKRNRYDECCTRRFGDLQVFGVTVSHDQRFTFGKFYGVKPWHNLAEVVLRFADPQPITSEV